MYTWQKSPPPVKVCLKLWELELLTPWQGFFDIKRQAGDLGVEGEEEANVGLKGNSNSHGARPVHLVITMIKWFRTSRETWGLNVSRRPMSDL